LAIGLVLTALSTFPSFQFLSQPFGVIAKQFALTTTNAWTVIVPAVAVFVLAVGLLGFFGYRAMKNRVAKPAKGYVSLRPDLDKLDYAAYKSREKTLNTDIHELVMRH